MSSRAAWWRSESKQLGVLMAMFVLLLTAGLLGVTLSARDSALAARQTYDFQLNEQRWIQSVSDKVRDQIVARGTEDAEGVSSVMTLVTQSAQQVGLHLAGYRPINAQLAQLWFDNVEAEVFFRWADLVSNNKNAYFKKMTVSRSRVPGSISVQAEVGLGLTDNRSS